MSFHKTVKSSSFQQMNGKVDKFEEFKVMSQFMTSDGVYTIVGIDIDSSDVFITLASPVGKNEVWTIYELRNWFSNDDAKWIED